MTKTKRIADEIIADPSAAAPTKSRAKNLVALHMDVPATVSKKPCKQAASQPAQALPYAPNASKHQRILALLQRDTGASILELQSATDWQAHSVRGFLSATVRKKLQLPLIAELRATGERVYRIAGGEHA